MGRIRINKKQIREYAKKAHASRLAEAASDIETVGDLKAALKVATQAKRDEQGKEALKDLGKGVLADILPMGGTISTIFDLVKTTYSMDDSKRTGSALDALDVDDHVSAIVDDPIENAFIKKVAERIEGLSDDTPIRNLNMTKLLSQYLRNEFESRTVAGFTEGKRMKISKRQIRSIIKEALQGGGYSTVIVMSPTGDSVLVDGREVDPRSIAYELEVASGQDVPPAMARDLENRLMSQMRTGYVEMPVSWSPDTGWKS